MRIDLHYEDDCVSRLRLGVGPVSEQRILLTGALEVTKMILTDTQQVALGPLSFADRKGNVAQVQAGSIVWASSDPTVLAVTPAADGLSAVAVAGKPGVAQVTVAADADPGDGVVTITGTLAVEVQGGLATSITIPAGAPTEQSAA